MSKVPLTSGAVEALKEQSDHFEKRTGPKSLPGEPIFFDPAGSGDTPRPFDPAAIMKLMLEALRASGADEALLYAAEKTDRILTDVTYAAAPKHVRDEWDAAVEEFHTLGKRGRT